MKDKIGKLPKIESVEDALKQILFIAKDKRNHVMLDDCVSWLELKMKVIRKFARKGIKLIGE